MIPLPQLTPKKLVYRGTSVLVYCYVRATDGATVIVKLPCNPTPTPKEIARLQQEYALLREANVPQVVRALDLILYEGTAALVLEDAPGMPLSELLQLRKQLDIDTALRVTRMVATALDGLHHRGIVHRDVNPNNILVEDPDHVVLIDLSIATRVTSEQETNVDALECTLAYASPEQTGRVNRAVDFRSDLYSLGVTLFEMLAGELPFTAQEPLDLMHSHIARPPPPLESRAEGIPPVVCAIVKKLLAKSPEDRYQTARGLLFDLDTCLWQWSSAGRIDDFLLGQRDRASELHLPQRLFGREREMAELMDALTRAEKGSVEVVLVAGNSGVGKSALVDDLRRTSTPAGANFVTGKFDQLQRSVPYSAIFSALRDACRHWLTMPDDVLQAWKIKLQAALGQNGKLLTDVLPELELILGPQPAMEGTGGGGAEARNRFHSLFQRFIGAIGELQPPLVFFLDDLQWADPASLDLLEGLLRAENIAHLLMIGAYRDSEVDANHPLTTTLANLSLTRTTPSLRRMLVEPLTVRQVAAFCAEALDKPVEDIEPLAQLIHQKTQGNPFFLIQLLRRFHDAPQFSLDLEAGSLAWDIVRLREIPVTDNVVTLMADQIRQLSTSTQNALRLAACIGHSFDLETLAVIHERTVAETFADVWPAQREGLVVPYGFSGSLLVEGVPASHFEQASQHYRFVHDRVQQAAYALIEEEQRRAVHLRIGRLLWATTEQEKDAERLFEVAAHLNAGSDLMSDPDERRRLALLNLEAAKKAKTATAFEGALAHFEAGQKLLPETKWENDYELAFDLHIGQAECAFLVGRHEQAHELVDAVLSKTTNRLHQLDAQCLRVLLLTARGSYREALVSMSDTLSRFGLYHPTNDDELSRFVKQNLRQQNAALKERSLLALAEAPVATSPEIRAVARLLVTASAAAFFLGPPHYPALIVTQLKLSLEHGLTESSGFVFATFGTLVVNLLEDYQFGRDLGSLGLTVCQRFGERLFLNQVEFLVGMFLTHHCAHFSVCIGHLERVAADSTFRGYAMQGLCMLRIGRGDNLASLLDDIGRYVGLTRRAQDMIIAAHNEVSRQFVANLLGLTRSAHSFDDEAFDEKAFLKTSETLGFAAVVNWYFLTKAMLAVIYGDPAEAIARATEALPTLTASFGYPAVAMATWYIALARVALLPTMPRAERDEQAALVEQERSRLATWAKHCPENFQHKLWLLDAELARLQGRFSAIGLYTRAIKHAREQAFVHEEALASELCGKFYLEHDDQAAARLHLSNAHQAYRRWGAVRKVIQLEEQYPSFFVPEVLPVPRDSTTTRNLTTAAIDTGAVLRAAEAIAKEIVLEKVVDRLMHIVAGLAGAQKGVLLLVREGRLLIEASIATDPELVEVNLGAALDSRPDLPRAVLNYVRRTRSPLVLANASLDAQFAWDPVIAARKVRSLLCIPLLIQGKDTGLLYLEHGEVVNVFCPERVALLEHLSAQAAIAIQNASLVAHLESASTELRRAKKHLEEQIAQRTLELSHANAELLAANEKLSVELIERERAEQERETLHAQLLATQEQRMAEMSTPFIPITDDVMVMPLIGTMDTRRAERVLQVALEEASRRAARTVILDITGIKNADTYVVDTLVRCARALRLLGVKSILCGLRGELAQTFASFGVDLVNLSTHATLKSAIAQTLHARRRA